MVNTGTQSAGGGSPEERHEGNRVDRFLLREGRSVQEYDFSPKLKFPRFDEIVRRLEEARPTLRGDPLAVRHFSLLVHQAVQSYELDGKRVQACQLLEKAVKILGEELGPSSKELIPFLTEHGRFLLDARRVITALRSLHRAFQLVGENWPISGDQQSVREMRIEKMRVCDLSSKALLVLEELPKAERIAKEYHRCSRILFGDQAPETALALARIGQVCLAQGKSEESVKIFQKVFDDLGGITHYHDKVPLSDYILDYGRACLQTTKLRLGSSLVKQAEEMRIRELGEGAVYLSEFSIRGAHGFFQVRQVHETEKRCARAFEVMSRQEDVPPVLRASWHELRASCSISRKRDREALDDLQAALTLREKFESSTSTRLIRTRAEVGGIALRLGEYSQAREQLLKALGSAIERHGEGAVTLVPILKDLGILYEKLGGQASSENASQHYKKSANFLQWALSIAEKEESTAPSFLAAMYRRLADAHRMARIEPEQELQIREKELATLQPLNILKSQLATALLEAGDVAVFLGGRYDAKAAVYLSEAEQVALKAGITNKDFSRRRTELHALALIRLGRVAAARTELLKLDDPELQSFLGTNGDSSQVALQQAARILYRRYFKPTSDEDFRFLAGE